MNDADARWLAAAAALAERARPLSRPNPAVACILVKEGVVVGRGWTRPGGRPHAEAVALGQAGPQARGATAYVTLEPCAHASARGPACADLLAASGVARVVVGAGDPDPRTSGAGVERLRGAGIAVELADDAACRESLVGYLVRAGKGRPYVTLKLALTADGFVARTDGTSKWITGEAARAHAHRERARSDAIVVGGGTLRIDDPRLDVRLPGLEGRSPRRLVLTRGNAPAGWTALSSPEGIFDLGDCQYLLVEGGAQAARAFLAAGLVDRVMLYRAPVEFGEGMAVANADFDSWRSVEFRRFGPDTLEIREPAR